MIRWLGLSSEIPYALPPGRFEDPVALPNDYRYEAKEYIQESLCQLYILFILFWLLNSRRWRAILDATQPLNDGQAQGKYLVYILRAFFEKFFLQKGFSLKIKWDLENHLKIRRLPIVRVSSMHDWQY